MNNPLKELASCGQSPWLDNLQRSLIETGALERMIEEDGLKGITSNPSIFEKSIGETDEYTFELEKILTAGDQTVSALYEHLAIADIRAAADLLAPVYEKTGQQDGYVSLECSPYLANDTQATIAEAHRLWAAVARPNLMVKVPATPAGLPAIRHLIGHGLNVNVTLLFSASVYQQVAEAYIAGLEDLAHRGGDLSRIGSVASFFVSRIDSAIDKKLDQLADKTRKADFSGKVAIANAKRAYLLYQTLFTGPRWEALAGRGAKPQRLLWASTSTKNAAYKDTLYVETLVGRDTVNTMPPATMDAFRKHGEVIPDAIERDVPEAEATLAALESAGISLSETADELVVDGVRQFADAFDKLLSAVARRRRTLYDGASPRQEIRPGSPDIKAAFDAEMEVWRSGGLIRRLWIGDQSLWSGKDEHHWLGWLGIIEDELADLGSLRDFAASVKQGGFTDLVLLGMGGSSLGPEVLAETFGNQFGWPRFHMLDSTDPAQINTIEQEIDLAKTLFIVSSKSGNTLEPTLFTDYFFSRVVSLRGVDRAGDQFVAVTDPGSALEREAKHRHFAHIFPGTPSIGGRYSVLSKFGLVPAAAMGLDIRGLLQSARRMAWSCGPEIPPEENPGVQLGIALGVAATRFDRDKVTIVASPGLASVGAWLEQLLAESTGKQGRGLIPVAGEPLTTPERYGNDRIFAYLELEGEADLLKHSALMALEQAGHPVIRITLKDIDHLAEELFRWEIATAVAGAIIGINPFNQPDVEASKDKTRALMAEYEKSQSLPPEQPVFRENGIAIFADPRNAAELGRHNSLTGYLRSHFERVRAGDYVAVLAYIERDDKHTEALRSIRTHIRDNTGAATCVGFGPRFQHSTGQAYKGGANTGVFLEITCDDPSDIEIPGHGYSFGVVKAAQARGDLDVLVGRGRRALRVHLKNVDAGLSELARATDEALDERPFSQG